MRGPARASATPTFSMASGAPRRTREVAKMRATTTILTFLSDDSPARTKGRIAAVVALLILANIAAWAWALVAFRNYPLLIGAAALAYSFGLRHAFDADHIAAIDNVTRKLTQEGKRPVGVGLFFSLGHSTIVVALSVAIAVFSAGLKDRFDAFKSFGAVAGTLVSASFLFAIAIANVFVLVSIARAFARARSGDADTTDLDPALGGGLMARLFRRLFRTVERSWAMYPIGLLFGLGFDTATEIGLLGISAAQAAQGLPIWSILVFPALFTAGMTLIDTADSVLMLGAYGWAFVKPQRKLFYNLAITATSIVVALLVGGLEVLNLVGDRLGLTDGGGFWGAIGALNDSFGAIGYLIVGVFVLAWIVSAAVYRLGGYDRLEVAAK
jgi:high-affinity nickel-transport protein